MFKLIDQPTRGLRQYGPLHFLQDLTPLGGDEVSTSDFVHCEAMQRITGSVYSDQAGTLKVQMSADGVNVDHEESIDIAAATANGGFIVDLLAPYLRLVYTNKAAAQTVFRCNIFGQWGG